MDPNAPKHLDLKKDRGLTILWPDGSTSYYSINLLRRMSPSADMRQLREEIRKNPLTVLPSGSSRGGSGGGSGALTIEDAEMVGNYAIKFRFSDGHASGIYTWGYLREIGPDDGPGGPE